MYVILQQIHLLQSHLGKYNNNVCIQRHMLYIHKHSCLSSVPTATSSVTTNTCCMSTDKVVYPGTHVVYLVTQHILEN